MTSDQAIQGVIAICSTLSVLGTVANFMIVRPLLKERKENQHLKGRIEEMVSTSVSERFGSHGAQLQNHESRIGSIEVLNAGVKGAALGTFITKHDYEKCEERSAIERQQMTQKLEQGLRNDAAQNEALETIKRQVSEIFTALRQGRHQ